MRYQGGSFLIHPAVSSPIFTPEDLNEDQKMYAKAADDFLTGSVFPVEERIEHQEEGLIPSLIREAGKLGLLMIDIPEKYGGLGLDKATSMLVSETLSKTASFMCAIGAHMGIGTLPIVYFGTEEQKKKYLPKFATGELISAYALTEPGSGSDALSAKCKATLSEDGKHYILNGTKQFITNAGFADIFIVFAKVEGSLFTAFIVERNTPGLSTGPEEKKMGIRGSSTRSLILENAKVPIENVLGEVGKGHKIAFNVLNVGRFKLGVGCAGGCKKVLEQTLKYASERQQFGKPLNAFRAIQEKLAKIAAKTYALESMSYRIAGYMDEQISQLDKNDPDVDQKILKIIEDYAIEDSIVKVFGSETLQFATDEAVQIHGGYGFVEEYPVERAYRDSRINRIFEGTNEINRMLIPGMIFRRVMKGELPLLTEADKAIKDIDEKTLSVNINDGCLTREAQFTELAKRAFLYCTKFSVEKHGEKLQEEQEILIRLADMAIELYALDSTLARVHQRVERKGEEASKEYVNLVRCLLPESQDKIMGSARQILSALFEGKELETRAEALSQAFPFYPFNTVKGYRQVADKLIQDGKYRF